MSLLDEDSGWCNCCWKPTKIEKNDRMYQMKDKAEFVIIEKRYGCYRAGVYLSLILIFLLLLICIPLGYFTSSDDQNFEANSNSIILIVLIVIFVIIGILIVIFINYQHREAFKMRMKSESGLYTLDRARKRRQGPTSSDSNGQEMQKLNSKQQQQPTNFYLSKEIEANIHHNQTKLPPV